MIVITPRAAEQIRQSARETGIQSLCLRIAARVGDRGAIEYGMGFDDKADDDARVASEGIDVLVSPGSVELLTGATLDFVEVNPGEQRFIFSNPNDPSHKPPKQPNGT